MVASDALEVPAGQVVKMWARVGILVDKSWPMVAVEPFTVREPERVVLPETARVPIFPELENKLVELAVVEKKLVVVAEVPVA